MTRTRYYWLLLFGVVGAVLLVDQLTKRWIVPHLALGESVQPIPALFPFFQITRSQNLGAAFGFLPQAGSIFLVIAVIVVLGMLWYYPRITGEALVMRVALGLVMGGALGNAVDRALHGAVIDFIHYQIPGVISNVSNLADHAIVGGVIVLLVDSWRTSDVKR